MARRSGPTPIALLGLRGLGKTVLLNAVRERSAGGLHLQIEVETGVPLATSVRERLDGLQSSVAPIARRLAKAIDSALRLIPLPSFELPHELGALKLDAPQPEEKPEALPLGRAIETLNDAVARAGKYLTITIDEIQDVDIAGFRSLVARVHQSAGSPHPILLACAGLPEAAGILAKLRTYARRWDRFELDFLSRAETSEAIEVPLREAGVEIDDVALDRLIAECAGYPFFVQKYASAAWNRHRGNVITADDADAVIPHVRAMVEKLFYSDAFRALTSRERLICNILADLGPGPHDVGTIAGRLGLPSSAIASIRTNLIKKGIVFVPEPGTLAFRMPLADRYVREHGELFASAAVEEYARKFRRDGA